MKKVLPPSLFVVFVCAMVIANWVSDELQLIAFPYSLSGLVFIFAGLLLAASGSRLFKKVDTNILTFDKPDKLVTTGVYRYSRNPMYLGFVVAILGVAILLGGTLVSLFVAGVFFVITDRWYIAYEEKMMIDTFGKAYIEYCHNVRRWI